MSLMSVDICNVQVCHESIFNNFSISISVLRVLAEKARLHELIYL